MSRLIKIIFLPLLLNVAAIFFDSSLVVAMTPDDSCDITGGKMEYGKPADLPDGTTWWGYYKCSSCATETKAIPTPDKGQTCENCGAPHTNESFYATSKGTETVSKDQLATAENIDEAQSGEKRSCPYCKSSQFMNGETCTQCGDNRGDDGLAFDSRYNPEGLNRFESDQIVKHPKLKKKSKVVMWAAGAVMLVASTVALSWGLQKVEVTGTVSSADYIHTIALERFEETTQRDWESGVRESSPVMPVDGSGERAGQFNIRNPRQEIHHYEKEFVGYRTETYTDSEPYTAYESRTVNNGNGSFTQKQVPVTRYRSVTKTRQVEVYRDKPIYKVKVDYDTYLWFEKFRRHISGSLPHPDDQALPWPEVTPGPLDRLRHFSDYKVIISYEVSGKTKSYEVTPSTESEFRNWRPGDQRILVRNNFGMILEVKPVGDE